MAEISPELAARIESLKSSHAENPARYFMPLASAYREAGETTRAEELLRENLKRHPGYLSAHVLLGRCLADRGAVAEARNEFTYVLSVDQQNLIALRTLGDMAAAEGNAAEARRWYGDLLSVDPMNAEARAALSALDAAAAAPASTESAAGPAAAQSAGETAREEFGMVDLEAGARAADALPAEQAGSGDFGAWGAVDIDAGAEAHPAQGGTVEEPGFDAIDFGSVDLSVSADHGETAGAGASDHASAADSWGSVDDGQNEVSGDVGEPLELHTFYDDAPQDEAHDDGGDGHEVVTETMAELYARQGFLDRAADVYRELITRRGDDPALVRRLEELEQQMRESRRTGDPELEADPAADEPLVTADAGGEAPDWLQTVDAVSTGQAAPPLPEYDADATLPEGRPHAGATSAGDEPVEADFAAADFDLPPAPAEGSFAVPGAEPAFSGGFDIHDDTVDAGHSVLADDFASPEAAEAPVDEKPGDADAGAFEIPAATTDWEDVPPVAAPAVTGDAFADSFAAGFAGAAADAGRDAWEAPSVRESTPEPIAEASAAAEAGSAAAEPAALWEQEPSVDEAAPASAEDEQAPVASAEEQQPQSASADASGGVSITSYLSSILTWRPSRSASPDAAVAEPAAGADQSAGDEQPGDEPWLAGGPAVAEETPVVDESPVVDEPWLAPAAESSPDEPWAAASEGDGSPALESSPDEQTASPGEEMPWASADAESAGGGTEPAGAAPSADAGSAADAGEAMPWETSFELSPEVPGSELDRAAPRQEPTIEPGGFSFEDFFAERPADQAGDAQPKAAAPAPEPEPAPQPALTPPPAPAAPPAAAGSGAQGEDDEDLESFQAWLQSLKR